MCQNQGDEALFEHSHVLDCTHGWLAIVQPAGRIYCIQTPKSPKGFERKEKRNQATASDSIKNPTVDKILRHCQYFLLNFPFGNFQMCCVSSEKQKYANGVYPKNNKNKNSRRQSLVHIQQSVLVILSVCVSDFLWLSYSPGNVCRTRQMLPISISRGKS